MTGHSRLLKNSVKLNNQTLKKHENGASKG